jgi:hypothetical protein
MRVRTKYRTFSRTTHNKNIHQLIDRPPKPCPMAYESSDDGHKSHPTPSLMLSPPLLSRPSILPRSRTNNLRGSTKMGRFYVWAYLRHKMCSGGGTNKTKIKQLALNPFNRFNGRSRWQGLTGGCNNQLWMEETESGRHNNYYSSPGPIRGHWQLVLLSNATINIRGLCL